MDALGMLRQQLDTVHLRVHHVCDGLDAGLLTARVAPRANPVGFLLWHLVRSQDWAVNTAVRGGDEVARRPPWAGCDLFAVPGTGTGFDGVAVRRVVERLELPALVGYADAVHQDAVDWLASQDESALDAVPGLAAHCAGHPEYQVRPFLDEMGSGPEHDAAVRSAGGLPTWLLLTSVSITHAHRHLGEVDLTLGVLTGRAG